MEKDDKKQLEKLSPATRIAHAGVNGDYHGSVNPPIFMSTLFAQPSFDEFVNHQSPYTYTRGLNPTVEIVEKLIAHLERGEAARCFSSGMAAIASAICSCVSAGDHVVAVDSIYGPAKEFLLGYLSKFDVETTLIQGDDAAQFEAARKPNTKLYYLESPSTFLFRLQDLGAVATLAKEHGIKTIIDNSWASPLFQQPLAHGMDIVVHSATKYLCGHSDVISGVVVSNRATMAAMARREQALFGGVIGPFEAWLLLRGMRTLDVRMRRHEQSALQIASWLESRPQVRRVHYPALASHPQRELALKQTSGSSGLFSIELEANVDGVRAFVDRLSLFSLGYSWGGYESLVYAPIIGALAAKQTSGRSGLPETLVRLSIGLEEPTDLITDLEFALAAL